jgi:hypothetical protein
VIGKFNVLTDGRLRQIGARYENLLKALSQVWEALMRPRYFEPSQRLQNLQDEAKRHPEDAALQSQARELAAGENDTATVNFDRDFHNARARLLAQQASDVASFVRSRAKDRPLVTSEIETKPGAAHPATRVFQPTVRPHRFPMPGAPRRHSGQDAFLTLDSQSSESEPGHDAARREAIDDRLDGQLFRQPGGSALLPDHSDESFGVGSGGASSGRRDEFRDEPPLEMDDDQSSGSLDDEMRPTVPAVADHGAGQTVMSSGEDGDDEFEEDQEDSVGRAGRPSVGGEAEVQAWQEIDD